MMDQGVSYEAIEGSNGSAESERTGNKIQIKDKSNERWIREQ
jgi:hypothetical protein